MTIADRLRAVAREVRMISPQISAILKNIAKDLENTHAFIERTQYDAALVQLQRAEKVLAAVHYFLEKDHSWFGANHLKDAWSTYKTPREVKN